MGLPKYQSQEWWNQVIEKSRTDVEYLKKNKDLDTSVRMIITDYPGGVDVLVIQEIKDGKIIKLTREEKPAPSEWRALKNEDPFLSTTFASYDVLTKIGKGEMNPQIAIAKKALVVHGNMLKIFAKMGKFNALSEMTNSVKCEF